MATPLEPVVQEIARSCLGSGSFDVERLGQGVMNHMFKVRRGSEDLCIVRIYPASREKVAKYEPALIEQLHALGCRVPQVIGHSANHAGDRPAYLVYRYVHGHTLQARRRQLSNRQLRNLGRAIAENLQRMAAHKVSGFGGLITADAADDDNALEFVRRSLSRGIETARRTGVLASAVIDQLQRLHDSIAPRIVSFDGTLGWGDLADSNILLDDADELAALIDFESCFALDRALSIGYFRAVAPDDPLLGVLIEEARSIGLDFDERNVRLCAALRAARMARFAHTTLPSGIAQRPIAAVLPGAITALAELIVA